MCIFIITDFINRSIKLLEKERKDEGEGKKEEKL